VVVRTEVE